MEVRPATAGTATRVVGAGPNRPGSTAEAWVPPALTGSPRVPATVPQPPCPYSPPCDRPLLPAFQPLPRTDPSSDLRAPVLQASRTRLPLSPQPPSPQTIIPPTQQTAEPRPARALREDPPEPSRANLRPPVEQTAPIRCSIQRASATLSQLAGLLITRDPCVLHEPQLRHARNPRSKATPPHSDSGATPAAPTAQRTAGKR